MFIVALVLGGSSALLVIHVMVPANEAEALARALLERRLIACANLVPSVRSIYRWQGRVEDTEETLLILKTERERWPALERAVKDLHSYELPEILALEPVAVHDAYAAWVRSEVAP